MQEISPQMKPDGELLKWLADFETRHGPNPVLRRLIQGSAPVTADAYIALNWMGQEPEQMDDDEREVVEFLRQRDRGTPRTSPEAGPPAAVEASQRATSDAGQ